MTFLPRYVTETIAKSYSLAQRRALLNTWVDRFAGARCRLVCIASFDVLATRRPLPPRGRLVDRAHWFWGETNWTRASPEAPCLHFFGAQPAAKAAVL